MDITLPDGSGLDIYQGIKTSKTNVRVLIISANLTELDLGAVEYLTKPFHLSELNARIKSVLT